MIHKLLSRCLPAAFALVCAAASLGAQDDPVVGTWKGVLEVAGQKLEIGLHVAKDEGGYTAKIDSITQNAMGIPVASFAKNGDSYIADAKVIGATYTAKLTGTGKQRKLAGEWAQGGMKLPLDMTPVDKIEGPNRPQLPKAPFPYDAEEVSIPSTGDVTLAGTLTLPKSEGPHAVAIMITGSGGQDRDESLAGHKPFLVLADHLTRNGLAVLRYDDRGIAKSTGDFAKATSKDFADDVRAAIAFLKARKDIDTKRIGLIGHSEGGLIAPMVASGKGGDSVAFSILLAPPTVKIDEIIVHQQKLIARAEGQDADAEVNGELLRRVFAAVRKHDDKAQWAPAVAEIAAEMWPRFSEEGRKASGLGPEGLVKQVTEIVTPWMVYLLDHDPQSALRAMHGDVLAMFGGKDLQVDPAQNLPPMNEAFAGRTQKPTIVTLADHNHLFQRCTTGSPSEYAQIEETFSPEALATMTKWLERVVLTR